MVAGDRIFLKLLHLRDQGAIDADDISLTLIAAVYAVALQRGQTPRAVLDGLWEALPACSAWSNEHEEHVRTAITNAEF